MGLSFAIVSLLMSQTGANVSFAADSVTVGELVKDLARQSGTRLAVTATVAPEPVVVQFEARPLDEVRTRLAESIGAFWIDQGGVLTLSRPTALVTDQARQERRQMANHFTRLLDARLAAFEKAGPFTRAEADKLVDRYRLVDMKPDDLMNEQGRMANDNPLTRATIRALRTVDPTRFIQMRVGQRIVFSDFPTAAQSPLTAKGREAFAVLRKEIALMEEAKVALGSPKKQFINFAGLPVVGPAKAKDPYGKSLLIVQRYGPMDFRYELTQVAKDGRRLSTASGYFPDLQARWGLALPKTGIPIKPTNDAVAFGQLEIRGGGVSMGSSQRIDLGNGKFVWAGFWIPFEEESDEDPAAVIRPKLIDPVRYDPLGIVAGSLLRQIATRRKQPLMATLGDDTLKGLARQIGGPGVETEEALWTVLLQSSVEEAHRVPLAKVVEGSDWIDVRPYFPVSARTNRFDRRAVRDLIAEVRKEGALTLAAAARYGKRIRRTGLDYLYAVNGDAAVGASEVGGIFNAAMPFLIGLSGPQWERLREDAPLVSQLSSDQRELVRQWLYEDLVSSYRDREERTSKNPMQVGHLPLTMEPTELFPTGPPVGLRVAIERTEAARILAQSTQGLRFSMDPASLGLFEGMVKDPAKNPKAARRSLSAYRPATQISYSVKLRFAPEDEMVISASETRPVPGSKFGLRSSLPEAVLKEVDQVREAVLRNRE